VETGGKPVRESVEFARIVAFTDGVFAIAITLLVLSINVPPSLSGSAMALLDQVAPVLHSHERVPLFRLFYGRASEAEAEGDWVGDPKQSPTCGGSVRLRTHTRQTPTDDIGEGPRALLGRGLMTESAPPE